MVDKKGPGLPGRGPRQRSIEERKNKLAAYEATYMRHGSQKATLEALGIPASTFYRWVSDEERGYAASPLVDHPPDIGVNTAIRILASTKPMPRFDREQAFFRLVAWLGWGENSPDQQAAVTAAHISYLCRKHKAQTVFDMPEDVRERLNRALKVERFLWMFSPEADAYFWENGFPAFGRYSIQDVIAEITGHLLTTVPNKHGQGYVSLTAALKRQRTTAVACQFPYSLRALRERWAQYASTAVFQYIFSHEPKITLYLHPSDPDLVEVVDEALDDPEEFRAALSRCKSAQRALMARLDPRATAGYRFPSFPRTLGYQLNNIGDFLV
ncbi:hypothetical protein [Paracoccus sp. SCSIO 75233]|uniref:hypothetical protein n=1 Tax=Paracoccus sp. SCSIO 75233 TaxID=3017782 RepID=UPI0022EFF613|nr:hypothetical protein [Paracoccus sp. SCSIO 75233]WBU55355.1 hypothetical protein PAF12_18610 [Paracoccus sp. SCSIO 75233]